MARVYEEIVDFLAAGTTPTALVMYRPSVETQQRLTFLLTRQAASILTEEERLELEHYLQLEHLMRLAKARARQHLAA